VCARKKKMQKPIILDLCGGSGSWSKPYLDAGFDVRVITLPEHDVCTYQPPEEEIYGILAAPPCTKFSRACWQIPRTERDFAEGMKCVRACMNIIWSVQERGVQLKFWALENPDGYLTRFMGYPVFSFQPWMFGQTDFRATKRTMLWGYFNAPRKTVLKRTIPFVSPYSRPAGDGQQDDAHINTKWANVSAAERAKTCECFASAFFLANREDRTSCAKSAQQDIVEQTGTSHNTAMPGEAPQICEAQTSA
jgi:hypothetical protein